MTILGANNNTLDYFIYYKKEKYSLGNKKQDGKKMKKT